MELQQSRVDVFEKFTWKIENFSHLNNEKLYSEPVILGGYPWYLNGFLLGYKIMCSSTRFTFVFWSALILILGGFFCIQEGTRKRTCQFIWMLCNLLICPRGGAEMWHSGCLYLIRSMTTWQSQKVSFSLLFVSFSSSHFKIEKD